MSLRSSPLNNLRLAHGWIFSGLMLSALVGLPGPARGQKAPAPAAQPGSKRTTIGDITISGYNRVTLKSDLSGAKISGANTLVEVPDKNSRSRLVLHADEINIENANNPGTGHMEMNGRVSYTLTQQTPEGARVLKGTAGKGSFRRETKHIDLSDGVHATLTDPRLEGPGTLHAGAVTIDISAAPYSYNLEGSPDVNDIRFTTLPAKPKEKSTPPNKEKSSPPNPESQIGPVHIHHFSTGEFQVGKTAQFDGAQTVAELLTRTGKSQGTFRARHFLAGFAAAGGLTHADANGTVHYHIERSVMHKDDDGKVTQGRQVVTGTCDESSYDMQASKITLDRNVDATITDTMTLLEPATVLASRLVVTDDKILRYTLSGSPNHRRLQFTPRPAEPKAAAVPDLAAKPAPPAPPTFALGSVTLSAFETGVFEPGKRVEVTADNNQDLILDTSDANTKSSSHIETHKFTADLAPSGEITHAQTGGPVTFHIQQLTPSRAEKGTATAKSDPKTAKPRPRLLQALDGNAGQAVFVKKSAEHSITLQGPFTAKVTDPENLVGPGVATGASGDSLLLDLRTRSFELDTPMQTGTLVFQPRPKEPDADKQTPGGK